MSTDPVATRSSAEHPHHDPALDVTHQHHHEHIHHAVRNSNEDVAYTTGTTTDPSNIPPQSSLQMAHEHKELGLDKDGLPAAMDEEKGSRSNGSIEGSRDAPRKWDFGAFYRKYRWAFHIFWFVLFTG